MAPALAPDDFEDALRAHAKHYHHQHPFHRRMNDGGSSREEIRGWVANRFYYQANIPRKDGAILSSCPDREVRRRWVQRIIDHDGTTEGTGGIESWLRLGEAVGLTREEIEDERHLLPGVRFAVDAYVTFTRTRPWVEAVASSLTELFAPDLMADRLASGLESPRRPATPNTVSRWCASTAPPRRRRRRRSRRCPSSATCCGACSMPSTRPMARIDDTARPRLAPHVRMRFDAARGQHALLSPETVWVVNDTGAAIVELCDGRRTVAEIQAELQSRYAHVADGDVHRFLADLVTKHGMEVHRG
jgi:coenzyme PQQ biosynthesis protein PqqD